MFVTDAMIAAMAERYGAPQHRDFVIPCTPKEIARITSSQKDGRNHDVTLYIRKDDLWIVIAKHFYPPELYRAPSGGIHRGEDFHTGIARELAEEIGCEIALKRFLLQTAVQFTTASSPEAAKRLVPTSSVAKRTSADIVCWRSFVFYGEYLHGDFQFTDHHEIREVRLARWEEFDDFGRIMRSLNSGGLRYRAELHEAVSGLLESTP